MLILFFVCACALDKETSPMSISTQGLERGDLAQLLNEISAPYEVPQFPIEQIEEKLQIQRQINCKWVQWNAFAESGNVLCLIFYESDFIIL